MLHLQAEDSALTEGGAKPLQSRPLSKPRTQFKLWERALWEQSLLAIQALRSSRDRVVFIAGKPCSHKARSHNETVFHTKCRVAA
ncbi:hypothetical protein F7R20_15600 [Pseudomonas brassicacearum subsp. brassicacearum]|nr:hypothetical protein F7R20_15600 [Pseudomonas brassicacearum subsp. brassicacearum]PJH89227.1 hypothetical protein CVG87_11825 [Pseudomonas sp. WCS365]QEO76638.1 hypothetical protein ELZ14_03365 [Pseudomonas brassicacearum]